jgi:ferrochelatase
MRRAVLLVAHGTVDSADEIPAFLANIRRGHASPELVAEVRRRFVAVGGSPLNRTNLEVARKLEAKLALPVRLANRLWHPYPKETLAALIADGITDVAEVPLAQHSAHVYAEAATLAASELGGITLRCAVNYGQSLLLTRAYARRIEQALAAITEQGGALDHRATLVVMTAHSLPVMVVRAGDAYEREFRASTEAIAREAKLGAHGSGDARPEYTVAFQSQGMSAGPGGKPMEWLGPDLRAALDDARARGKTRVVMAPVGFLADHVEILYDIDIEAAEWAKERGLTLTRTASLNADDDLIEALAAVATPLLSAS